MVSAEGYANLFMGNVSSETQVLLFLYLYCLPSSFFLNSYFHF